ncbi:inorganic phosphate transporter [Aspergillus ibericus CBS 121593]|uniref:Inorganic phosphate transporter n=1 Tax=Aspergillus ibericus CBS 121593 TaxID=1448316 RepID=A0A395GR19_9EURO|nr:inorganic phosphate transporter [Aspergillus ibericus CBS 121593]RAK97856.1 inorganic phosphate transporter [Aspergillus ibericus CBS 121593]
MGPPFKIRLFLNPWGQYENFQHLPPAQRHDFVISRLENARRREWLWVVLVAGIGFFTDAYCIFSVNMVTPMLSVVYWNDKVNSTASSLVHNYEVALGIVTLGGALVGQLIFGIAADIWGRRKMYGLELIILIFSTLGMAMASSGKNDSMSMIGVLLFWRFFMGLGVGADYPLSAVICSEFAPTRIRGRMLAAVFFCQSIGEAAAALVALIAVAGFRHSLPDDPSNVDCDISCARDIDKIWRLIVGLGAVPAFIALWFRLTIIESPRYTVDVLQNTLQAVADVSQFYQQGNPSQTSSLSVGQESHEQLESTHRSSHVEEGRILSPVSSHQSQTVDRECKSIIPASRWSDFKRFLRRGHNLRILMATSLCWFCLDLPFYGLGLMNADVINVIWSGSASSAKPVGIYQYFLRMSYQSIVVVSSGAIVGSVIAILVIDRIGRRTLQFIGFCWLLILNIIIGAAFHYLSTDGNSSALVVLYLLTQIFFNFGPNTTTYIIPAELFPTRFRSTCHGIAAASGKLGSIIAQCFLGYVSFGPQAGWAHVPNWLGYALLCLAFFMLMGLITTYWIPDTRDSQGNNKSLEQIAAEMEPDIEDIPLGLRAGDSSSEYADIDS